MSSDDLSTEIDKILEKSFSEIKKRVATLVTKREKAAAKAGKQPTSKKPTGTRGRPSKKAVERSETRSDQSDVSS
jgi:hypothetical protein